jgi:hypothetical protein
MTFTEEIIYTIGMTVLYIIIYHFMGIEFVLVIGLVQIVTILTKISNNFSKQSK